MGHVTASSVLCGVIHVTLWHDTAEVRDAEDWIRRISSEPTQLCHDLQLPRRFVGVSAVEMPQWAPFGDGGRNCVGMKLAVEEAKVCGTQAILGRDMAAAPLYQSGLMSRPQSSSDKGIQGATGARQCSMRKKRGFGAAFGCIPDIDPRELATHGMSMYGGVVCS